MTHVQLMFRFCLVALINMMILTTFASNDAMAKKRLVFDVGGPGKNKIPLALPNPVGQGQAAKEFYDIIVRDLELSGMVQIIDPKAYVEPDQTGVKPSDFKFKNWEITGAIALGKTKFEKTADRYRVELWVYDVLAEKKLAAKRYPGKNLRKLAHKVANELIFQLTGKKMPFDSRFAVVANFSKTKEIYLVDFDGENKRRITRNGSINLKPSWSPDGKKIAFTSYMKGNPDLFVAHLNKRRITRLSSRRGINVGASWSPTAKHIAVTLAPNGNPDIYTIHSETGRKIKRLTKGRGIDTSPAYSPDGKKIAYVSERSGGAQIFIMNSDGTKVKRLSFVGSHNTDPVFSPDGKKIAFVNRNKNFDIYVINLDGSGEKRITQDMGDNEDPTWSEDGNYLAFSSTRTGRSHIWMSTSDGFHQVQLTKGRGGYTNPSWSPTRK